MRWTGSGAMKGDGKTIIYSGHSKEHLLGVGICLRSPVGKALIGGKPVNKRIITARCHTRHSKGHHNSGTYPPTMEADDNKKYNFYKILQNAIDEILRHDIKLFVGGFNGKTGKSRQGMGSTISPHGSANITNNNGERFTLFCSLNDISISDTFFKHKDIHKLHDYHLTITQRMKLIIFSSVVDSVHHYKMLELIDVLIVAVNTFCS